MTVDGLLGVTVAIGDVVGIGEMTINAIVIIMLYPHQY